MGVYQIQEACIGGISMGETGGKVRRKVQPIILCGS
jgi:hypothetical protein